MYPVSCGQVVKRALQKACLQGADGLADPSELTDMVNVSLAEWYDLVRLTTWGGQYFRSSAAFTTISGQYSYPLPPTFAAMLSVDIYLSPTWKVCGRPYQEEERNIFTGPALPVGWTYGLPIWYQLQGPNIRFLTNPASTYQVGLNFVPVCPRLMDPSSSFDSIQGWEEWIVIDVARKLLFKDGSLDAFAALGPELERQRERIERAAPERDAGNAEVVHDVVGVDDGAMSGIGGWP